MHIPDGFLDARTSLMAGAISVPCLAYALRRVSRSSGRRSAPLLGVTAAFVFAAQLVNFPIAGGTSGHLLGGVLCAVLLGPAEAVVTMACVLIVQCLMFADGGLTALGANLLNIGIVDTMIGWAVYRLILRVLPPTQPKWRILAAGFGAWCGTVAAALTCSAELALAGTAPWRLVMPAMTGIHMIAGLVESAVTAVAVAAMIRVRPGLLESDSNVHRPWFLMAGAGLAMALFMAPFASSLPDGLENVLGRSGSAATASPFSEYHVTGLAGGPAILVAGVAGALLAFGLSYGITAISLRRETRRKLDASGSD